MQVIQYSKFDVLSISYLARPGSILQCKVVTDEFSTFAGDRKGKKDYFLNLFPATLTTLW